VSLFATCCGRSAEQPARTPLHDSLGSAILTIAFAVVWSYPRIPVGEPMQPNKYDAATTTAVCVWCYSQYLKSTSRARDGQTFCSKKCEIEARFWLHDNLKTATE
jgi:hypothetical protein